MSKTIAVMLVKKTHTERGTHIHKQNINKPTILITEILLLKGKIRYYQYRITIHFDNCCNSIYI